jgi:hypothetical protein
MTSASEHYACLEQKHIQTPYGTDVRAGVQALLGLRRRPRPSWLSGDDAILRGCGEGKITGEQGTLKPMTLNFATGREVEKLRSAHAGGGNTDAFAGTRREPRPVYESWWTAMPKPPSALLPTRSNQCREARMGQNDSGSKLALAVGVVARPRRSRTMRR